MTAPAPAPRGPVTLPEVSRLISWMRRLSDAGADPDPAELAAFQLAKRDLLARIQNQHARDSRHPCQPEESRD